MRSRIVPSMTSDTIASTADRLRWMVAGFAAPGLGGTEAAKESFAWLGMPTAGAIVIGTVATTVLVTMALRARKTAPVAA